MPPHADTYLRDWDTRRPVAGFPRLGESPAMFTALLGPAEATAVRGQQLLTFHWGLRRLKVLFDRGVALAIHCVYPTPQPPWVATADSQQFLLRKAATVLADRGRFDRRPRSWTLSNGSLTAFAFAALVND